jgi:cytosine/adenosine deaminase-related metal-dependent hydrolase
MHVTRPVLRDSPLRGVSFGEVIGLGKRRGRFEELLPMAIDGQHASEKLVIGLTPHSPYTLEPDALGRCVKLARERGMPLAIHLAETPYEVEFVRSHTGPLKAMWEQIGSWDEFPGTFDGSPVEFAKSIGLLDHPTLLAHVNYCDDGDMELLASSRASVVYCPRTHRYFGHPAHRWREMISRGINVAVGTDSCASSPDLNLVEDLRLLHEIDPAFDVEQLWRMATVNATRAIQWERGVRKKTDFVVFDVKSDRPLAEVLESNLVPREVWIAGQRVTHTRPASPG